MPFLRSTVWGNDFPRSIIDSSGRKFGRTIYQGKIIEDGIDQRKRGRTPCGCLCSDWPISFPFGTRATWSFGNDGEGVERLLDAE